MNYFNESLYKDPEDSHGNITKDSGRITCVRDDEECWALGEASRGDQDKESQMTCETPSN